MVVATREHVATALLQGGAAGDAALVQDGRTVSYDQLAARVEDRRAELRLPERSLVVLPTSSSAAFVTTYLALLADGHVPLLAGPHADRLAASWEADALVVPDADGVRIERRRRPAGRCLHPDLALLLSTSGSTGAAKLVRLSHDNVLSNARSIGCYLGLTPTDRAITSLPLHYCYGLSVLHSHLLAGASVVLTAASVVDPCFGRAMRDHGVTNLAGVPHTFDLLDRAGPELVRAPSLRFLTQAGGRLPPERVREWVERTSGWGADFYVMYGQTEATARIAYLPPALAARRPGAIGVPIPGGELELRPVAGQPADVGELVYRGPNVMLGYAVAQDDLAAGATRCELATGDLARYHADDGVYEIVGRRSRFVKPFGLRIDLDAVEGDLAAAGVEAAVAGDDERLVVWAPVADREAARRRVVELTGLPPSRIALDDAPALPRTPSGKVDHATLLRRSTDAGHDGVSAAPAGDAARAGATTGVAAIFADVLGRTDVTASSTFVSLGGDSLNYIECSVRLEQHLGRLPADWHLLPVGQLETAGGRRRVHRLDTTALLRTAGIAAVVSTHMSLWYFPGGAHLMLAVVGYNLGRFHLSIDRTRDRVAAAARTVGRLAGPVVGWVGVCMLLVGGYSLPTLALVNNYAGPAAHREGRWHYWFIEAVIQLLVITTVVLAVPAVRRLERRAPYLVALAVVAVALPFRYHWLVIDGLGNLRFRTHGVAWFFALGWLAQRSTTTRRKLLTTAICLLTIPGFFGRPEREWFIAVGIVVLVWWREVPLPRLAIAPIATIAAASMWIYISHFRIWPPLERNLPSGLAYVLTVAAGVLVWRSAGWLAPPGRRALAAARAVTVAAVAALRRRRTASGTPTAAVAAPGPR